ncbi:MAG: stage II sporulation protein D [Dethiobacter sp.]|jgi:stage II sporulation protein D|nr:stage II sporulation protein D [Dethiobacter sp.]
MSKFLALSLIFLIIIIIVLPAALVRGCSFAPVPAPRIDRSPIESPAGEINIRVYRHDLNEIVELPLEEYLVGVVAAEMPASFGQEALKAQAVVARTYTVNQMIHYGGPGCSVNPGADICTISGHCQAWETEEDSLGKWPAADAAAHLNKIRQAVRDTAGKVITYDGKLIDAVFHSTCGGQTEDSEKVWSTAMPYLRGVACTYCEGTRWWLTEQKLSSAKFATNILPYVTAVPVSSAGRPLLEAASRSDSGRVLTLRVAGESVRGRDFRSAMGLPSTNFTWKIDGEQITFTSRGYGHGVGLCQYGADGQAKAGKTYEEIISYYYTGIEMGTLSPWQ